MCGIDLDLCLLFFNFENKSLCCNYVCSQEVSRSESVPRVVRVDFEALT